MNGKMYTCGSSQDCIKEITAYLQSLNTSHSPQCETRLSTAVVNCRGIKNKIYEFSVFWATSGPSITFGTGSWHDDKIPNCVVFPSGFNVYCKDKHNHGTAVFLLADRSLCICAVEFPFSWAEVMSCRIKLPHGRRAALGSCYNPSSDNSILLLALFDALSPIRDDFVLICSDFNLPDAQ